MSNYYHNSGNNKGTNNLGNSSNSAAGNGKAHAPYNFVPLNEKVVKSEWETWKGLPPFDRYNKDTLSGTIQISLTTKTPLYIRDMKPKMEDDNPVTFFGKSIGEARIPGSSIRGMIRNLVEIASYGKFHFTDRDRRLYYRAVADTSSLGQSYRSDMLDMNGIKPKANPGVLIKEGEEYYIKPSKKVDGVSIFRIDKSHPVFAGMKGFKRIKFIPVREKEHQEEKRIFRYAEVSTVGTTGTDEGYVIKTGNMFKKKREWIIFLSDQNRTPIPVPKKVIEDYKNDITRNEQFDLLNALKNNPNGVPCFYLANQEKVTVFGHNPFFRKPYGKSIGDFIPKALNESETPDISEAIFGNELHAASRVFFEDLFLNPGQKDIFLEKTSPKILASPKPTTFQHYIKQPLGERTPRERLISWKDKGDIRGYKLYWHRDTQKTDAHCWSEGKIVNNAQHTIVTPVIPGIVFTGAIRFDNLSPIELGALLFVLELPENHYHKLGMGKPLGLGSVKIETSVSLSDRNSETGRYTKLFTENTWHLGNNDADDKIKGWISEFERFVLNAIEPSKGNGKLWDTERMKKLKKMLDFGNTQKQNWNEKTRYMQITPVNEFKDRKVLPEPEEV